MRDCCQIHGTEDDFHSAIGNIRILFVYGFNLDDEFGKATEKFGRVRMANECIRVKGLTNFTVVYYGDVLSNALKNRCERGSQ